MFPFFKKKKTEEALYLEDLERRTQAAAAHLTHGYPEFEMTVDDVFSISGRGTVVTGTVSQGRIANGEQVLIQGRDGTQAAFVDGIEAFRKILEYAQAGDVAGLLLRDVKPDQVRSGDVLRGWSSEK